MKTPIKPTTANLRVEEMFHIITRSSVFSKMGKDINLPSALIFLCNAMEMTDSSEVWEMSDGPITLGNLIVSGFHVMKAWDTGTDSMEHVAMCKIIEVHGPGISDDHEYPRPESDIYPIYHAMQEAMRI